MLDLKNFHVVLTETNTVTIVTGAMAYVIDKKTGKVIKKVPEKPVLSNKINELPGGPTPPWLTALGAGVSALEATEGVRGLEELHMQAAKMVTTAVEALAKHAMTEMG